MNKIDPKSKEISESKVPTELRKVLVAAQRVEAIWRNLTPIAQRDFITWIESAKQAETRKRRIERVPSMLMAGKRRPCCYAIVPMNFYKALAGSPRAKAMWKNLTPSERRDFVAWIDGAKQPETHMGRIEKACAMLVAGKRRP